MAEAFHQTCSLARAKFAQYCSVPASEDVTVRLRWNMSGAHLMFLEMAENIHRKAETIAPQDEQAFVFLAYCMVALIHHHHHMEETAIFPALEPEFKTDVRQEHAAFHDPLEALDEYLKGVLGVESGKLYGQTVPNPNKPKLPYDGAKIKRDLEILGVPLFTHLMHEIDWLAPENIRASGVSEARLLAVEKIEEQSLKTQLDPFTCLVAGFGHIPPYSMFPSMPWLVKKILVPWIFYWKHRTSWRFFPTWSETGLPVVENEH